MNNRNYSLDALRGIMMLLGIVVHAGVTYTSLDVFPNPIQDPSTSIGFDFLILTIHAFRMPVFFVLSGFFAALLYSKKGLQKTLLNRTYRIVFPFLAAMVLIAPLVKMLIMHYARGMEWPEILDSVKDLSIYHNLKMGHLWFLYYLAMIYVLCHLVIWARLPFLEYIYAQAKRIFFEKNANSFTTILFFSLLSACLIVPQQEGMIDTSFSFVPDPLILSTYIVYFAFGYILYASKDHLTPIFSQWKSYLIWAVVLSLLYFSSFLNALNHPSFLSTGLASVACALLSWLMVFGLFGFFLHQFNRESKALALVSKSSYWIYLTHLPLTILFGGLLADFPLPHVVKFLMNVVLTYFILMGAYKLFVERTFIGVFLNGRK